MTGPAERVYYTGDMANAAGWFLRSAPSLASPDHVRLIEVREPCRELVIRQRDIGRVYTGTCNPRFVTEAAYRAYYDAIRQPQLRTEDH